MARKPAAIRGTTAPEGQPGAALTTSVEMAADVKKAVEAVAVHPRAGKLTLLSRKLFNVMLFLAQRQGLDTDTYQAHLSEICSTASFDSNDTALIKEHLRKMNACQVEWNTGVKGARRWGVTTFLSQVEILEEGSSGRCVIEWAYAPKIKQQLLEPEAYTRLSLHFQSSLRSSAALALYEICCRYATSPSSLTMRQPWAWWRPVLTGVPDQQSEGAYQEYKYFKRDVLKPAVAEVNKVTDLTVEMIEHKLGRRVDELQFRVARKAQASLPLDDGNVLNMEVVGRLTALGLTQKQIEDIYGSHEEGTLKAVLDHVESRVKSTSLPAISSPAAYLKDALRKGYGAPPPAIAAKVTEGESPSVQGQPRPTREDLRRSLEAKRIRDALAYFEEIGSDEQAIVRAAFEAELLPNLAAPVRKAYQGKGVGSPLAAGPFGGWLAIRLWGEPTESDLLDFMLEGGSPSAAG